MPKGLRRPESLAGVVLQAAEDEVAQLGVLDKPLDHREAVAMHARLARVVLLEGRLAAALLHLVGEAAHGPHVDGGAVGRSTVRLNSGNLHNPRFFTFSTADLRFIGVVFVIGFTNDPL